MKKAFLKNGETKAIETGIIEDKKGLMHFVKIAAISSNSEFFLRFSELIKKSSKSAYFTKLKVATWSMNKINLFLKPWD